MTADDPLHRAKAAIDDNDRETALAILTLAAQTGNPDAQFLLGTRFFHALDLLPMEASLVWLRRASDAGHPEATYELALFHHHDAEGIEYGTPTTQQAVDLLIRAAELGYVEAQRDLGACFATGEWFGPKDEGKARHWYRRAAEQGHASARFDLATMYLNGEGGEQDIAEGLRWLAASAEQDETRALGYLATIPGRSVRCSGRPGEGTGARET